MKLTFDLLRFSLVIAVLFVTSTLAQTTVFTYQGRLTDSTMPQPTNGIYEMQYKLYDAATVGTGNQVGVTQTIASVSVVNGIFTVQIDQGGTLFRSADVFIEIGVRPSGSAAAFTILAPRQQITTAPLSIRSRISNQADNAANSDGLGGLPASNYVQTTDTRLADDRNPLAGSANYIQNQTAVAQAADLKISGNATVGGNVSGNVVDAGTQFNLGGGRFLSGGSGNVFAGLSSGAATTTGGDNSFFGTNAGKTNVTGFNNAFFGTDAGRNNTGSSNSFFGRSAGFDNTTGTQNVFFGLDAGRFNTLGQNNSFIGSSAGRSNTIGVNNTFTGLSSGFSNTQGADNSFVGLSSGFSNTLGSFNTFAGRSSGQNNSTGGTNSFFGASSGATNTTGSNNSALGYQADVASINLSFGTAIGAGSVASASNTIALGRSDGSDTVRLFGLGSSGATTLCRNALFQISTCTSGGSFIDNSTIQQATSNFNISGNGTVGGTVSGNIVNTVTNYRIAGTAVLSTPNGSSVVVGGGTSNHTLSGLESTFVGNQAGEFSNNLSQANTFIGYLTGRQNTSGKDNTFVGKASGNLNVTGSFGSFFGSGAGNINKVDGSSFFGYQAGYLNGTGLRNSFFGFQAGQSNQVDNDNSFFGYKAGLGNNSGSSNSFFGSSSGIANNNGDQNAFFGSSSGIVNTSGSDNAFFGEKSGLVNTVGTGNTFIGFRAGETTDDDSFNTAVGYRSLAVVGNGNTAIGSGAVSDGGNNTVVGVDSFGKGTDNTIIGSNASITNALPIFHSTAIGADAVVTTNSTIVLGTGSDTVKLPNKLTVAGTTNVSGALTAAGKLYLPYLTPPINGEFTLCTNISAIVYRCGFPIIGNVQAPVDPIDPKSGLENSTKLDRAKSVTVNWQLQIQTQAEQIKQQQEQIAELKKIVCAMNPTAKICGN